MSITKLFTMYSVKIKHYNRIFKETVSQYRGAVNFFIDVCLKEWDVLSTVDGDLNKQRCVEVLTHSTKRNPSPKYDFDSGFYKFPTYLRRGAITEAIGKVSSYMSNLENWNENHIGNKPSAPIAGYVYPCLYRRDMYQQAGPYQAKVKVFVRNTWDWITVELRKSDVDYIQHHCAFRKMCAPTLQKRGKEWFLDFPFEEKVQLSSVPVFEQIILAVDLGINSAATVSAMTSDGTILARRFLSLPKEQDSLNHALNRIKKAQQHGNHRTPRLWAKAVGINDDIAVKTANFIVDMAVLYSASVIVFEHLDLNGKKRGGKKQRLHHWKARYVQEMVTGKAHRLGMRISHICAWGTSRLAYDGSGRILRGKDAGFATNALCKFANGKTYNCDLSASYNIGARYFIREILKSLPAKAGLQLQAKVPDVCKRTTCTLSTLISLNVALNAIAV